MTKNNDSLNKFKLKGPLICYANLPNVKGKKDKNITVKNESIRVNTANEEINNYKFVGPCIIKQ